MSLLVVNGWMALSALALFGGRLDLWVVGILSTQTEAGLFSLAAQVCVGFGLLSQAVITAMLPAVSRFDSASQLRGFLLKWRRVLPLLLLFPICMWFLAEPLIRIAFGAEYLDAAPILIALFVASVMTLAGAPLMLALLSLDEPRILTLATFLQLALRLSLAMFLVPGLGGLGMAYADVASRVIAMALIGAFIWRTLQSALSQPGVQGDGGSDLTSGAIRGQGG